MAIFGSPAYHPSAGFAFPRSYLDYITFGFGANAIIDQNQNEIYVTDGNNTSVHVVCNFYEPFWAWSSNKYSLDYLVVDWWIHLDGDPTKYPLSFIMDYEQDPVTLKKGLFIWISGWTTRYPVSFPQRDRPYWFPPNGL